jgi:hypothetical protein
LNYWRCPGARFAWFWNIESFTPLSALSVGNVCIRSWQYIGAKFLPTDRRVGSRLKIGTVLSYEKLTHILGQRAACFIGIGYRSMAEAKAKRQPGKPSTDEQFHGSCRSWVRTIVSAFGEKKTRKVRRTLCVFDHFCLLVGVHTYSASSEGR